MFVGDRRFPPGSCDIAIIESYNNRLKRKQEKEQQRINTIRQSPRTYAEFVDRENKKMSECMERLRAKHPP